MIIADITGDCPFYWSGIWEAAVAIDAMCVRRGLTGIAHRLGEYCSEHKPCVCVFRCFSLMILQVYLMHNSRSSSTSQSTARVAVEHFSNSRAPPLPIHGETRVVVGRRNSLNHWCEHLMILTVEMETCR